MPRYIDADKLKAALKDLKAEGSNRQYVKGLQDSVDEFFPQIIDCAPTADVEPVRHGRWEDHYAGDRQVEELICTVCKELCKDDFDYCPNCGAKMDGGISQDNDDHIKF